MAQAITHHGFQHAHHEPPHPDPTRIGALGATMALNLGALLVLAMPMQRVITPQGLVQPPRAPAVDIVERRPEPPPPPMPIRPTPTRPEPIAATPAPASNPPIVVEHSAGPLAPPTPALEVTPGPVAHDPGATGPGGGSPVALRYVDAPAPPYPRPALRAGLNGTVWLRVLVDERGRPITVEVDQGSGHRVLDDAARRQVLSHWRFQPALQGDQPVQAWGRVPIEFRLDR